MIIEHIIIRITSHETKAIKGARNIKALKVLTNVSTLRRFLRLILMSGSMTRAISRNTIINMQKRINQMSAISVRATRNVSHDRSVLGTRVNCRRVKRQVGRTGSLHNVRIVRGLINGNTGRLALITRTHMVTINVNMTTTNVNGNNNAIRVLLTDNGLGVRILKIIGVVNYIGISATGQVGRHLRAIRTSLNVIKSLGATRLISHLSRNLNTTGNVTNISLRNLTLMLSLNITQGKSRHHLLLHKISTYRSGQINAVHVLTQATINTGGRRMRQVLYLVNIGRGPARVIDGSVEVTRLTRGNNGPRANDNDNARRRTGRSGRHSIAGHITATTLADTLKVTDRIVTAMSLNLHAD